MRFIYAILVSILLICPLNAGMKKNLLQYPARATWKETSEIQLVLNDGISVNEVLSYFLVNDTQKLEFPIKPYRSYANRVFLKVPSLDKDQLSRLVVGNLKVVTKRFDEVVDETSIQLAELLDQHFYYDGKLGLDFSVAKKIKFKLWAPTALGVKLNIYNQGDDKEISNQFNLTKKSGGVWEAELDVDNLGKYYLYQIDVFQPETNQLENYLVTDPYSYSLSVNSTKSQIINPESSKLQPSQWRNLIKPKYKTPILYESHLRDLTAGDSTLPESLKGTFLGLVDQRSKAYWHLKDLAQNGLTHLHLLPVNDFSSVNEKKEENFKMDLTVKLQDGGSDKPQAELNSIRHNDDYNWGYDPYHYFVPEGSYAVEPNGESRILEFRQMVQKLNATGLRLIVDVVFNHTYSSGSDRFSVLNKIVPLYYYRLNDYGQVHNSSCCADTATENKMMEKLMIDSLVYWTKTYKVDGFRFDLMSFHSRKTMLKIKDELSKLTLLSDGVDGKELYLYGEGWNFGSLLSKPNNDAFVQENSYGAGIGLFNDRFRDAIRGGTTDHKEISDQGFATGLFSDFNHEIANRNTPTDLTQQREKLLMLGDVVKIGLAGNLRDYRYKNFVGDEIKSSDFFFRGARTAYSKTTEETVNYVSAHDGYSLYDAVMAKSPFYAFGRNPGLTSAKDKQRMVALALGMTLLSQGVPFIEGGSEILRSKSGDTDSYDSGDWFNQIRFDYEANNWARGLPPSFKNYSEWSFWYPRLSDPKTQITKKEILENFKIFKAFLKIRSNSRLFGFKNAVEVQSSLSFIDNDSYAIPGFIALTMKNNLEEMIVLINVNRYEISFSHPLFLNSYKLHPELNEKVDLELMNFSLSPGQTKVPARTIVVLVPNQKGAN